MRYTGAGNTNSDGDLLVEVQGTASIAETNPPSAQFDNSKLDVDTTNLTAGTYYYPSAEGGTMDYFRDFSCGGKIISSDGTVTISMQVANSADATIAEFNDVMILDETITGGYNIVSDASVGIATLPISFSMSNMNYRRWRAKVVVTGSSNTVRLEGRSKA